MRNGRPIYRPLTPGQEVSFLRRLETCEAVWNETGEPLAVTYALTLTYLWALTISAWLEAAQVEVALQHRTPDQAKAHRKAMCFVMRYMIVRDLLTQAKGEGRDLSQEEACRQAVELLAGTAFGNVQWRQIDVSYRQVKDDLRNGTARGKYFLFSDSRYLRRRC